MGSKCFWQIIPWNIRVCMVHSMKIVVQKQKCQWATVRDNNGSTLGNFMSTVLDVCTYFQNAKSKITRCKIGRRRNGTEYN